jgi:predicted hotdog family 3-hydroxylacyl-ACP dehydratase
MMNPGETDILELIPQRTPMIMIDRLVYADERSAKGKLFINPENIFCMGGYFTEPGLIEFIAQTAAAFTGFRNKTAGTAVTEGYIASVKNLVIHKLPAMNQEIHADIFIDNEIVGYTLIRGRVMLEDAVLAECEMRILNGKN